MINLLFILIQSLIFHPKMKKNIICKWVLYLDLLIEQGVAIWIQNCWIKDKKPKFWVLSGSHIEFIDSGDMKTPRYAEKWLPHTKKHINRGITCTDWTSWSNFKLGPKPMAAILEKSKWRPLEFVQKFWKKIRVIRAPKCTI